MAALKYSQKDRREMRRLFYEENWTLTKIGARFDCHPVYVHHLINDSKNVPEEVRPFRPDAAEAAYIHELAAAGVSVNRIVKTVQRHYYTVMRILQGETHNDPQ